MTGSDLMQLALAGGSAGGLSLGVVLVVARWTANFIAGRIDKKEARVEGATGRLIEALERRLDAECQRGDRHEDELRECKDEHAKCRAEVMELKAVMQGYGDAREKAALIVAAEKRKGANE